MHGPRGGRPRCLQPRRVIENQLLGGRQPAALVRHKQLLSSAVQPRQCLGYQNELQVSLDFGKIVGGASCGRLTETAATCHTSNPTAVCETTERSSLRSFYSRNRRQDHTSLRAVRCLDFFAMVAQQICKHERLPTLEEDRMTSRTATAHHGLALPCRCSMDCVSLPGATARRTWTMDRACARLFSFSLSFPHFSAIAASTAAYCSAEKPSRTPRRRSSGAKGASSRGVT